MRKYIAAIKTTVASGLTALVLTVPLALPIGCGIQPNRADAPTGTVLVSVINVTDFEVTAVLSGILGDSVDTVRKTIGPVDSIDVPFVCIDELVVGDPLEPSTPGVTIDQDGELVEIDAFSVLGNDQFRCGDVIEIIVSRGEGDFFNADVFVFPPP